MKLDCIVLENFRQYYGQQRLTFSQDPRRNATIVHGVNGAGKTSLFLAINWCLYGEVIFKEGVSNIAELVSKEAISEAQTGDSIQTSVQLTFVHEGEIYSVSRSLVSVKQLNDFIAITDRGDPTMLRIRWGSNRTEMIDNPIGRMNVILPSNVRTYFLFDGERIDNFAKPEAKDEVRYAIYNVLKLEILKRGQKHLEDVANEYRRESKRSSVGNLLELKEKEANAYLEKTKKLNRKEEIDREIKLAQTQMDSISQTLMLMPNARALQQQRSYVERELEQCQIDKDDLEKEIREIAISSIMIVAFPAIERTLAILDEKRKRGEIPSNIRQQFIQDLIDHKQCICGRPFDVGSPEYHRLLAMKNTTLPSSFEDDVLNTIADLRPLVERSSAQKDRLDRALGRHADLRERIKGLHGNLSDLTLKLKDAPQEDISRLEGKRQEFQANIVKLSTEQGQIEIRLEILSKEILQLQKQIDEAEKNEDKERILTSKAKLAQRTADAISDVYQRFADTMRLQIEQKTNEIFKLLISKISHFQHVKLGEDYRLEVFDRYDSPSVLSAGERQVLSLSFITAMARISEEEAPLVMDTPFGRLDETHRDSVTEHLPELSDQLILFVTDTELVGKAQENLEPRIGAEYHLKFNDATSCTEIVKVR